eukprot:5187108-Pyramimonas_sp.AAC.1
MPQHPAKIYMNFLLNAKMILSMRSSRQTEIVLLAGRTGAILHVREALGVSIAQPRSTVCRRQR